MITYNPQERQKLIMKHYSSPDNKGEIKDPTVSYYSNRCVDKLFLKINADENKIKDIVFDGEGCAVFLASTDMMINLLKGRGLKEVDHILDEYLKMLDGNDYDASVLKDLIIFENVKKTFNRYECAKMIYGAIKKWEVNK